VTSGCDERHEQRTPISRRSPTAPRPAGDHRITTCAARRRELDDESRTSTAIARSQHDGGSAGQQRAVDEGHARRWNAAAGGFTLVACMLRSLFRGFHPVEPADPLWARSATRGSRRTRSSRSRSRSRAERPRRACARRGGRPGIAQAREEARQESASPDEDPGPAEPARFPRRRGRPVALNGTSPAPDIGPAPSPCTS